MKKEIWSITLFAVISITIAACTKTIDNSGPHLTKTQILAKNTWRVEEVLRNISGYNSHYLRTGENTTGTDYSSIRLTFKADGTGTYTDEVGIVHDSKWEFLTSDERNVRFEIMDPSAQVFIWNLVEISESSLSNTTAVGDNILVAARYTPLPGK